MEIPWFSTTSIQGLDLCAYKALEEHAQRIEHGDDFTGSNPTRFGSIVHEVAQEVHKFDKEGKASPDPVDVFDDIWRRHHLTDFSYFDLGRDSITAFIDRTLFDRNGVTVATEWPFIIDLVELEVWPIPTDVTPAKRKKFIERICKKVRDRGGVPVISMIDRIDKVSDEEYEIYDYKTNAQPFTTEQVEQSIQLALYDMAVRSYWVSDDDKDVEIKCVFDLFRHGRQATIFAPEDVETIRKYIINLWHQVHSWDEPLRTLNTFCGWCNFREDCPVYEKAIHGKLISSFAPDGLLMEEVYAEFDLLRNVEKLAKTRKEEFGKTIMTAIMENNDGDPLPMEDEEDRELYLQLNPRYEYPPEAVIPILQKIGSVSWLKWCAKISRPALEKLIKAHEYKDRIQSTLITTFASPSVKVRKRKYEPKPKKKKKKK